MYTPVEHEARRQRVEEIRQEAAVERHPTRPAREDPEPRPRVVRDLSWEFARYLDAQDSRASA